MTDRPIVYDGAIPQTTDMLNAAKGALLGDSLGWAAILGNVTSVSGLACTPTGPASMQVVIGQGSIYTVNNIDSTAYGDLGTDTTTVLKQGILKVPVNLTLTAPGTVGFSQNYLVQAIQQDVDGGSAVLSYFNAVPPNTPFAGPGNNGLSQFTLRQGLCTVSLVAGTAATTGTQTTPSPSAGNTGLYVITVANGQVTITSGNIATLAGAPFIPVTLPLVPQGVQNQTWAYELDTGTADALVITPFPLPAAYVAGQRWSVKKIASPNATTTPTLNVNGLGAKSIIRAGGGSAVPGDLAANAIVELIYDGTNFQICSPVFPPSGASTQKAPKLVGITLQASTPTNVLTSVATPIVFATTVKNNLGTSTFTSTTTLTIGAGEAGIWSYSASLHTGLAAGAYYESLSIFVNGTEIISGTTHTTAAATGAYLNASGMIAMNSGDTVQVLWYQQSGGTLSSTADATSNFSAFLISAY